MENNNKSFPSSNCGRGGEWGRDIGCEMKGLTLNLWITKRVAMSKIVKTENERQYYSDSIYLFPKYMTFKATYLLLR